VQHQRKDQIWFTRAYDIAQHCFSLEPGIVPGSLEATRRQAGTKPESK